MSKAIEHYLLIPNSKSIIFNAWIVWIDAGICNLPGLSSLQAHVWQPF